jgi:hypothetical protein
VSHAQLRVRVWQMLITSKSPPNIEFPEWEPAWLLAPNKSEALAYFNDEGAKPERYARVMANGNCFNREYMVG